MKAAFLTGIGKFRIDNISIHEPKADEVLVRIHSVGICGSDIHYYKYGRIGTTIAKLPYIIGHECTGIVEKNGTGATRFKPGTRVIVEPAIPCRKCRFCLSGAEYLCPDVQFLGTPPQQGAYSEFIAIPEQNLVELPDTISFEEGVIVEPLAVAVHSMVVSGMDTKKNVAIFGCGPIGLCMLVAAKMKGARQVFVTDIFDYKLNIAETFGADYVINSKKTDPVKFIREHTGGFGTEICLEASGDLIAMSQAIDATLPGGTAVLAGIPVEDRIFFNAHSSRRKGTIIKLLRRSNHNTEEAVGILKTRRFDITKLITHRFRLEDIERGFKLLSDYSDNVVKVLITL